MTDSPTRDPRYAELIDREARHWSGVDRDPDNPQLWDDPVLWAMVLEPPFLHLLARATATGGPVLELGCGEGDLAIELGRRGLSVHAIDLSPERVERARALAGAAGLGDRVRFEVGDLNVHPLPAAAYAGVVAHDSLHHILHVDALLGRAHDALRPTGRLIVSDFRGASALEKLVTAGLVAALPTRSSYARKWAMRARARALLATEATKRAALERTLRADPDGAATGGALHDASPFESISQASILPAIARRFAIVEAFTYCPFWYHAIPKLRIPDAWKHAVIRAALAIDRPLNRRGWTRGSYQFVEARPR